MKRIKLLVIMILISVLSTGCSVEYNINISSDTIQEEIIVNDNITSTRTKGDILKEYNKWYPTYVNYMKGYESIELTEFDKKYDNIKYYDKSITEINNGYRYKYLYTHNIYEYYDAYVLTSTFVDTTVQQSRDTLVLRTSKENFLCNYDYFDSLKVNITIDPKVYELNYTNTNNVSNNTYTWIINRNNCNDSQIVLTLNKVINNDINEDNKQNINIVKSNDYAMYIFCGILLIIILIGYFIFKKIKRKSEDFDIDD